MNNKIFKLLALGIVILTLVSCADSESQPVTPTVEEQPVTSDVEQDVTLTVPRGDISTGSLDISNMPTEIGDHLSGHFVTTYIVDPETGVNYIAVYAYGVHYYAKYAHSSVSVMPRYNADGTLYVSN